MSELKETCRPVIVKYLCDACNDKPNHERVMKHTGNTVLTYPMGFEHQCPLCKVVRMFPKKYPSFEFEEIVEWRALCKLCGGRKQVFRGNERVQCPECNGTGLEQVKHE